jgi:hypothetical protein
MAVVGAQSVMDLGDKKEFHPFFAKAQRMWQSQEIYHPSSQSHRHPIPGAKCATKRPEPSRLGPRSQL